MDRRDITGGLLCGDVNRESTPAAREPWQHYDLGHGYCAYTFFEQCPHRMACAKCDALDRLLERLADIPTPAGPTPRQLDPPGSATILRIIDVRQARARPI